MPETQLRWMGVPVTGAGLRVKLVLCVVEGASHSTSLLFVSGHFLRDSGKRTQLRKAKPLCPCHVGNRGTQPIKHRRWLEGWGRMKVIFQCLEVRRMVREWGSGVLLLRTESNPVGRCLRYTDVCFRQRKKNLLKTQCKPQGEWALARPSLGVASSGRTSGLHLGLPTFVLPALNLWLLEISDSVSA